MPDSTSPSRFHPKSWVLVCVWAEPTPLPANTMSAARRTHAVFVNRMGGLLAGQPEASRMIGAMDSHMAVVARPSHHEFLLRSYGAVRPRHVPGLGVALLAEPRLGQLEHGVVVRAVRVMAVRAALEHRLMIPEEGPALLRVAGEAGVV